TAGRKTADGDRLRRHREPVDHLRGRPAPGGGRRRNRDTLVSENRIRQLGADPTTIATPGEHSASVPELRGFHRVTRRDAVLHERTHLVQLEVTVDAEAGIADVLGEPVSNVIGIGGMVIDLNRDHAWGFW